MKYFLISFLFLSYVSFFNSAFANPSSEIVGSAILTESIPDPKTSITAYETSFTFDWNQFESIAPNKTKIKAIETYLTILPTPERLTSNEQRDLGKLLYKLGTYYTHVSREPNLAISKLYQADKLLNTNKDKAWIYNHLAYAYEQKYAALGNVANKEKALHYINLVITKLYPNKNNKEVAFAYCVKGLILNDTYDYRSAEATFKNALFIYEMLNSKDDQYARAKNRLGDIILDQNGRDDEAIKILKDVKSYWLTKKSISQDPYAARNLLSLGRAYLKVGQSDKATVEINDAIYIYKNVYGTNSLLLEKPYHLLAKAYQNANRVKQAAFYEAKAQALAKG